MLYVLDLGLILIEQVISLGFDSYGLGLDSQCPRLDICVLDSITGIKLSCTTFYRLGQFVITIINASGAYVI